MIRYRHNTPSGFTPFLRAKAGLTLIELLLYLALAGAMILVISIFLSFLLRSGVKEHSIAEVEAQGLQVMQMLSQRARNAQGINSPAAGVSGSALSLAVDDLAKDPTVFTVSGETIYIQEGLNAAVPLTSSRVSASGLIFTNLTRTDTPGVVKVEFALSRANPQAGFEYSYTRTFFISAAIRGY